MLHRHALRRAPLSERALARRSWLRAALAVLLSAALLVPLVPATPAAADEPLVFALIEFNKDAVPAPPTAVGPTESVTFNFTVSCSSTQTDCVGMKITDALPAPLELVSVGASPFFTAAISGNTFVLTFTTPLDEGGIGLQSGELVPFQAIARVPSTIDASFDGQTITNTAFVTVDNPDSNVQDDAPVLLRAPLTLSSAVDKTVTPSSVLGFPGTPVTFNVAGRNTSNTAVDSLVIQDPATPESSTNAFDYLRTTALSNVVFPAGAETVQVDWFDGTNWNIGTPSTSVVQPANLALVQGVRLTFASTTGTKIAVGASGSFRLVTETTADVSTLTGDFNGLNVVSSHVTAGADSTTPVLASVPVVITRAVINPLATKAFTPKSLVGGQDVAVRLGAENDGHFTLSRMTITEPKAGTTSLADQGIEFIDWGSDLEWPNGATGAEVSYLYASGYGAAESTTTVDTLPAPAAGETVLGFIASFTGTMPSGDYVVLPYTAKTFPVSAADGNLTTTDIIQLDVTAADGATATTDASDTLTRRSSRVNTTVDKILSPSTIYGSPGSTALLTLPASVAPLPPAVVNSTIGAKSLVVRDDDADFWSRFDARSIVATDVPATSTLTVRYLDGTGWHELPGAVGIEGPSTLSMPLPATVQGLEFSYVPTDAAGELPPGFNVQPNVRVVLRELLRGTSTPAASSTTMTIENTAVSIVENPSADPSTATATADDSIEVLPVLPGGPGLVAKNWHIDEVRARSNDTARMSIEWGTGGAEYHSVVISDTAVDPDDAVWSVEDSVFEAFDLVSIPEITPSMDPLLRYDAITSVEFYLTGTSPGWVAAAGNPCAADSCYGTFPGYELTADERARAIGVRFVVEENPDRIPPTTAMPNRPDLGSGVATSVLPNRSIDLLFEVRDTRRSDPSQAITGLTRGTLYNVADEPGMVNNDARVAGRDSSDDVVHESTAADTILIIDQPVTVSAEKIWRDGPDNGTLGVPPVGTDQQYFPQSRMQLTARNTSVARVDHLSITDPAPALTGGTATTPFDFVNLVDLVSITTPTGATSSEVVLSRGGTDTSYTIAQALALAPSALEDVTAITLAHEGRITSNASTVIVADTQLREFVRGTTTRVAPLSPTSPLLVDNETLATVTDAGGTSVTERSVFARASDDIAVTEQSYEVIGTKSIEADTVATDSSPAIQYAESPAEAKITLTGRPGGNARTTKMVFEDSSPSFWNAYNFSSFAGSAGPANPADRVQVDALVGVTYSEVNGELVADCALPDDCWKLGTPRAALELPDLDGAAVADIRGLRFTYTKANGTNWEQPFNPTQVVNFTVSRRETLIFADPAAPSNAVPSTLKDFSRSPAYAAPAPGEDVRGTYSNEMSVIASGGPAVGGWSADDSDSKQILFQHLPARVEIKKTPSGAQSLGVTIPYQIAVTNTGGAHDKDLGTLVVSDQIPVGPNPGEGAMLVLPNDPDTGQPLDPAASLDPDDPLDLNTIFSYRLVNESGQTQAVDVDVAYLVPTPTTPTYEFTLVSPAKLPKGWTLTINATMQLRPQLEAGTPVLNTATVTADQIFDTCKSWTGVPSSLTQLNDVPDCVADARVTADPSTPMAIVKGVRGVGAGPLDATATSPLLDADDQPFDDLGVLKTVPGSKVDCSRPTVPAGNERYYRYPCVPITRPGGTEEWVTSFSNNGNIPVIKIAAIDVLPHADDRGVIVNESRGSRWTPTLTTMPRFAEGSNPPADATLTVYYVTSTAAVTTRCNATDIQNDLGMTAVSDPPLSRPACLTGTAGDDLNQRNWQVLTPEAIQADPTLLASISAMKFIIDSPAGIASGDTLSVTYRSTTAAAPEIAEGTLGRDSIAYNSIAAAALGQPNDGPPIPNRFVIEPRKVGVALAAGQIELEKLVDGANAGASYIRDDFEFDLACVSVGQDVALKTSFGVDRNPFVITGGAAATLVQGIPLYASCTVSEADYGQTSRTITPETLIAQAPRSTSSLVFNPRPAFDDPITGTGPRPVTERSTITNTYELASLTVSKTIGTNPAVNAAGTAISYTNFRFDVQCTFFNGVSTVNVLNQTNIAINPGTPRTFTDLPAGANCTITERAGNGSAQITSVTTTATAGSADPTTGSTRVATIKLAAGTADSTNTVEVTNNFGAGSLEITKAFAGLGEADWATGSFSVNISCTLNTGSGSVNVWTGTRTFSKATTLTATIENIARGAVCAITEPAAAGGVPTLPANATIGNGTTVQRTVTNTFDYAQLSLTKEVVTDATGASGAEVILDSPFRVGVSCTFPTASTAVFAEGFNASSPMSFDLENLEPVTLTKLPAGAVCQVTEDAPAHADSTSIAVKTSATSQAVSTPGRTATVTLTKDSSPTVGTNSARIFNNYGVSSFTVTKELRGGAATQFGIGPFIMRVTCIAPDDSISYDGDVTLSPSTTMSVTITNIAADSVCSVVESNFASTGANSVVYRDGAGDVFDGTGVNVTDDVPVVTIENWYLTGSVQVTKALSGAAASTFGNGPFEVNLACTREDSTGTTVTVTLPDATRAIVAGTTETFTLLPWDATCVLTESDNGSATTSGIVRSGAVTSIDAVDGYTFRVDEIDNSTLNNNQAQKSFTITNSFEFAELEITKKVVSEAVDQDGDAVYYGGFPVAVDCVFNGANVYATGYDASTAPMRKTLEHDEDWLLEGLPRGAECTVEETNTMDAVSPTIVTAAGSAAAVTQSGIASITLAATNTAIVTNPYEVGGIELSKVVTGAGASAWGDAPVTVNVSCTLSDETGVRNVWLEDYVFQLVDGAVSPASVELENIAAGAVCTVAENRTGAANDTTVTVDGTVTAAATATVTIPAEVELVPVTVTNTFTLSEINVTKIRDGLGAALYGAGPFEVSLSCDRVIDGVTTAVDIPGGAKRALDAAGLYLASYTGLPTGASCTMTETLTGGSQFQDVDPGTFTLTILPTEVTVTNTFDDPSVIVQKTVSGAGAQLYGAGPFEVTITCEREVNGELIPVDIPGGATRELTAANSYTNQFDFLPSEASCSLVENKTTGATSSSIDTPNFVLGTQNVTTTVDLENTFELAELHLSKQVFGTAASNHLVEDFEVRLSCELDINGTMTPVDIPGGADRIIRHGEEIVYDDLPANAVCSIEETKGGGANMVTLSFNNLPLLSQSFTLGAGVSTMTMTNVFLLALTGAELLPWLIGASLLLLIGGLLFALARRRRV